MRAAVLGLGAVGARTARQLASTPAVTRLVLADRDPARARAVAASLADPARVELAAAAGSWADGVDVAVLAIDGADQRSMAERLLETGISVVATTDGLDETRQLLALDAEAIERGLSVVVGAGMSPGLSCVLAMHAAATFEEVAEVHVARVGTGGPACARSHHHSLTGEVCDWRDGTWSRRRAGSGRELCWFPDPVGAADCYRAGTPDALLLVPALPGVRRVTARVGANRRDRLTARLPMLRRPHSEGSIGALRVEVRGRRGSASDVLVLGALDRPASAAGTVAALAAVHVAEGRVKRQGAAGLAELVDALAFLTELAERGVKAAAFEGSVHQ